MLFIKDLKKLEMTSCVILKIPKCSFSCLAEVPCPVCSSSGISHNGPCSRDSLPADTEGLVQLCSKCEHESRSWVQGRRLHPGHFCRGQATITTAGQRGVLVGSKTIKKIMAFLDSVGCRWAHDGTMSPSEQIWRILWVLTEGKAKKGQRGYQQRKARAESCRRWGGR